MHHHQSTTYRPIQIHINQPPLYNTLCCRDAERARPGPPNIRSHGYHVPRSGGWTQADQTRRLNHYKRGRGNPSRGQQRAGICQRNVNHRHQDIRRLHSHPRLQPGGSARRQATAIGSQLAEPIRPADGDNPQ